MDYDYDYYYWQTLVEELQKVEFTDSNYKNYKTIKYYQYLFQHMSTKWLKRYYKMEDIANMWWDESNKYDTYQEYFNHFVRYLWYATDRMNLNRWAYLQSMINNAVNMVYSKLSLTEVNKFFAEENYSGFKSKLEFEAINWFNNNFDKLYFNLKKEEEEE